MYGGGGGVSRQASNVEDGIIFLERESVFDEGCTCSIIPSLPKIRVAAVVNLCVRRRHGGSGRPWRFHVEALTDGR